MSDQEHDRIPLIERFIEGCLTDCESAFLLRQLREDVEFAALFRDNIRADYLLREKKRPIHQSEAQRRARPSFTLSGEEVVEIAAEVANLPDQAGRSDCSLSSFPDDNVMTDLAAIVDWERNAIGIQREEPVEPKTRWDSFWVRTCAVSLSISMLIAVWFIVDMTIRELHNNFWPPIVEMEPDDYSARLTEMIDAVWSDENVVSPFKRGQYIGSDKLLLKSGILKLEFANGTILHLEGPADLVINDSKRCFCQKGQISVSVSPEAGGFEVGTPMGNIVDLGTEFYARISPENVQTGVIQGRVEVRTKKGVIETIDVGHEVNVDPALTVMKKAADRKYYVAPEAFQMKLQVSVERFVQKREETERQILAEPGLLAFYSLIDQRNGQLKNRASSEGRGAVAYLRSCTKTPGSLYGESVPAFFHRSSKMEASLSERFASLTVVMNIRIDRLTNPSNGLMVGGDFGYVPGSFNWFVTTNGELSLFVQSSERQSRSASIQYDRYQTPIVLLKSLRGTWCQVVLVFDGEKKTITQYLDGKPVSTDLWRNPVPIVTNELIFGNGPDIHGSRVAGNFGGAISEIRMYNRPLSAEELKLGDL